MMNYKTIMILASILILLPAYVNAFGLSTPPWEDKTLKLYPGEAKEIIFTLQNMAGDADEKVTVQLVTGMEVLKITDNKEYYDVHLGSKDVAINMIATVPQDAPIGKEWDVEMSLKSVIEREEGGMAGLTGGMIKTFKIKVVPKEQVAKPVVQSAEKKPEKNSNAFLVSMVIILITTVLVLFIISRRRLKKP